jgi:RimJ/RimL family protein N-acetyltransferase
MEYAWAGPQNPADHDAISRWVSLHSFGVADNVWPDSTSLGILKDGKPIAGFVFHDYRPSAGTVQYSGAAISPEWGKGPSLHYMFQYMFDGLNCQMVMTGNSARNVHLHRILERLGHKKHVIERAWDRDTAMYFWTLTREDWMTNKPFLRSRRWAEEASNVKSA